MVGALEVEASGLLGHGLGPRLPLCAAGRVGGLCQGGPCGVHSLRWQVRKLKQLRQSVARACIGCSLRGHARLGLQHSCTVAASVRLMPLNQGQSGLSLITCLSVLCWSL